MKRQNFYEKIKIWIKTATPVGSLAASWRGQAESTEGRK
jgi:hypothetical protein